MNDVVNVAVMKTMIVVMVVMSAVVMTGVVMTGVIPPEEHCVTSIHQNCSHLQK